jgi:predicted AAA+ superfamily ATPase
VEAFPTVCSPATISTIANGLDISSRTVQRYIDLLCDLLLVRSLQPWSQNVGKRVVKAPKIYLRDSGLAHALLGLPTLLSILGHPVVGGSWEAFVVENLCAAVGDRYRPYYYRTSHGAEVDLLFERGGKPVVAIEIKRSPSARLSRGFYSSLETLKPEIALFVHGGEDDWEMSESIAARSLVSAISQLASL